MYCDDPYGYQMEQLSRRMGLSLTEADRFKPHPKIDLIRHPTSCHIDVCPHNSSSFVFVSSFLAGFFCCRDN